MRSVIGSTLATALILTGCTSNNGTDTGMRPDSTGSNPANSTGVGNGPSMGRFGGNGAQSAVPAPGNGSGTGTNGDSLGNNPSPGGGTGTGAGGGMGGGGSGAGGAGGGR